jgi:biotin carboxyl carrier protein
VYRLTNGQLIKPFAMPDKNSITVNSNDFEYCIAAAEMDDAEIIQTAPLEFNLLQNNRSVSAKIIHADIASKKITVEISGEIFNVVIKDELDIMLDKMGFNLASNKQVKEIKAPMPGKVLEIAVCCGQTVMEGDKMLILEAMKMENAITINTAATIKTIAVTAGQTVEKGQLLIELE